MKIFNKPPIKFEFACKRQKVFYMSVNIFVILALKKIKALINVLLHATKAMLTV